MFFSGGTFGHESEVRESTKRQTGRRHQPRDMAENQNASNGGGGGSAAAGGGSTGRGGGGAERHVNEQKQMSSGPSFMDRMYAHDASATEPAHAARRHKSGPQDNLNVFSWQDTDPTRKPPPQKGSRGPRAAREVDAKAAVPTVEDRRAQESKKFETHSESTFLKFSDTPEEGQPSAGAAAAQGSRRVSNPAYREEGMMGELLREQQQRPHGKRVHGEPVAKRKGGAAAAMEDPGVAGFPGMGKRSAPRTVQRQTRKNVESNVLPTTTPPWAQHEDLDMDVEPSRGAAPGPRGAAPPAPTAAPAHPSYRIDEADYHDDDDDVVGTRQDHQRRMQEIEMYDDGDDDDDDRYAMAPPQKAAAPAHPRWLDEPKETPSAQQHQYNFDPDHGEFYEDDPNEQGPNEYR